MTQKLERPDCIALEVDILDRSPVPLPRSCRPVIVADGSVSWFIGPRALDAMYTLKEQLRDSRKYIGIGRFRERPDGGRSLELVEIIPLASAADLESLAAATE